MFLCVVDPGVGSERPPVIVEADGKFYVGPGNGLFELVQRRAEESRALAIEWKPERLSASFHGRDLFAPVAAMIARGDEAPRPTVRRRSPFAGRIGRTIFPKSSTSITMATRSRASGRRRCLETRRLRAGDRVLERARTFSDRPQGEAFWYENSNGLAEIAVNRGRADRDLGLAVGDPGRDLRCEPERVRISCQVIVYDISQHGRNVMSETTDEAARLISAPRRRSERRRSAGLRRRASREARRDCVPWAGCRPQPATTPGRSGSSLTPARTKPQTFGAPKASRSSSSATPRTPSSP